MKKLLMTIGLSLTSLLLFSQDSRFIYETRMIQNPWTKHVYVEQVRNNRYVPTHVIVPGRNNEVYIQNIEHLNVPPVQPPAKPVPPVKYYTGAVFFDYFKQNN